MIKALLLLVMPVRTWDGIAQAQRNFFFVLFLYVVPVITLSIAGEVYGRNYFASRMTGPYSLEIPQELMVPYMVSRAATGLVTVFLFALFMKQFSETFHDRHGYSQCFTLAAYSLGPLFLFYLLDAIPGIPAPVSIVAGLIFCLPVLYYGIPVFLRPDPPHAFGLFLSGTVLMVMITTLAKLFTYFVLEKKIVLPLG